MKKELKNKYTVDISNIAVFSRAMLLAFILVGLYFALSYAERGLKNKDLQEEKEEIREVIIFEGDTILLTNGIVDTVLKGGN